MTHEDRYTDEYRARVTAAYARYNGRYNNETYLAVQKTLVHEVCGAYQAEEPALLERALHVPELHAIILLVTDAALEVCDHPDMVGRRDALLRVLMRQSITEDTLHAIVRHWDNFEDEGDTFSAKFLAAGRAALMVHALTDCLHTAISLTNDIPGAAGNAAHRLIQGAYRLLRAAELLLTGDPSRAYVEEQVRTAERQTMQAGTFLERVYASAADVTSPEAPIIQAYQTLLVSEDGTYPGLVTRVDELGISIIWYKWGFGGETFVEWMTLAQAAKRLLTAADCRKRFGGLPKDYHL